MKGTLSEGVLPGLLRELYVGRKTGILYFTRGEERRGVRIRKGDLVNGHSNVKEEQLGETLVRNSIVTPADLERAREVVARDKKRLGVALQDLGILDKDHLEDALALHLREILLKVFSWNDGDYFFEEQDAELPVEEDTTLKLSTAEMILEAVRRVQDPDIIRYALGDLDRILGLSTDPLLRFQRVTLTPADGYILSRVDGTLSAREIIQMIPMVPEETEKSLFGLLCTGIAEHLPLPPKPALKPAPRAVAARPARNPVPAAAPPGAPSAPPHPPRPAPPAAAPAPAVKPLGPEAQALEARRQEIIEAHETLKTKNHFEVLGIPKASNESQVKEAYFRLARRFHPDTHHDPHLKDLADKIEAVFIRLGEAYDVLRSPASRSSYESDLAARTPRFVPGSVPAATPGPAPAVDPALEVKRAEEAIRRADKHLQDEKYWDAIQLLEPAIPVVQGKMKQRGRVQLSRAYLKNPHWVKRAEEVLQTVVREDPQNIDAYFLLGTIYKGGGLKSRATSMFRKVLDLKPEHEQAAAELEALAPEAPEPAPPESGGLLKKIFGKS